MPASRLPIAASARPQGQPAARPALVAVLALAVLAALVAAGLLAQVEGERGIAPIASTGDFEIVGIQVDATGKDAAEARENGWKQAQRKGWDKLWQQRNPGAKPSGLSDDAIGAMVTAVVIENEEIGTHRYVGTLGVVFDRARAGELLGMAGQNTTSAPMLVVPVLFSGGTAAVFEYRTPWQRAWAEFRTGASAIDYVRPHGGGGDSLLLTAGQIERRSRTWWRNILDQFGAADVIMPVARIERQWPGGPVRGTFTARYGPDNQFLDSFILTARDEDGVPAMMNQAVVRLDRIYTEALYAGRLQPDRTLGYQAEIDEALIEALLERAGVSDRLLPPPPPRPAAGEGEAAGPTAGAAPRASEAVVTSVVVQVVTPDAAAVDSGLAFLRGTPGVRGAGTVSIAVGGTSVMSVTFAGSIEELRAALQARGWQVSQSGSALSIRR